uniref:Protein kinase domain-containing protein n=1 Tax=Meloidogyne hapla TaxID=6305 RepID=A0A1I8BJA4_MELHA
MKRYEDKFLFKKVLILEFGGVNLRKKIHEIKEILNQREIWALVRKIVLAVKDMHRLIMHLDLKPDNMVYLNDTIKIIDFGSGHLIQSKSEENNNYKLANYCKKIDLQYSTQIYRGPENNIICKGEKSDEDKAREAELSTKSDIWSIGIVIIELVLNSPSMQKPLEMFRFLRGNITTKHIIGHLQIIKELNFFYKMDEKKWNKRIQRGYERMGKLNISSSSSSSTSSSTNTNQQNEYLEYLKPPKESYLAYIILILQIQKIYPLIFRMIIASLDYNQIDRPSSKGMLSFMNGKCYFRHEINEQKKFSKNPIFIVPKLIFKELNSLRKKKEKEFGQDGIIKINEIKNEVATTLTQLLKNKGIEEQQETEKKWSCCKFLLKCSFEKKNQKNIENNKTKIDLRRLKWDNTNMYKPPNVECDTESTAKTTFDYKEMSGYEGDDDGRSSFSLSKTPLREEFSSSPYTDYETHKSLPPRRSWSVTPNREEQSSYTMHETD